MMPAWTGHRYRPGTATIFAAVIPPMFIGMIDQTIVSTALPDIARDLGQLGRIGLLVTAYLAAVAIAAPIYGRLGDAFGRRKLMSVAIVMTMLAACCARLHRISKPLSPLGPCRAWAEAA